MPALFKGHFNPEDVPVKPLTNGVEADRWRYISVDVDRSWNLILGITARLTVWVTVNLLHAEKSARWNNG